jgi:hypothetical protein
MTFTEKQRELLQKTCRLTLEEVEREWGAALEAQQQRDIAKGSLEIRLVDPLGIETVCRASFLKHESPPTGTMPPVGKTVLVQWADEGLAYGRFTDKGWMIRYSLHPDAEWSPGRSPERWAPLPEWSIALERKS